MKNILILFVFLFSYVILFSQKSVIPNSCFQLKSQMGINQASSSNDNRGDFLDILKYDIHLDITDFVAKEFNGYTKIDFKAIQAGQNAIELDFLILNIDSITFMGNIINSYTYNDTLIHINFPNTLTNGNNYSLKVFYHGKPIQISTDWGGFFWNNTYAFNIGVSFTEAIHNYGKAWFPCFDNFTERSKFDFTITTQGTHKAFCNGLLQNETTNIDGTKTWEWSLAQEIPTYLASVTVANYETIYDTYVGSTSIPIQLAARATDTTKLKNSFIHLKDAMASFENRYGKYRFDRVGYCVTSFSAGAMEHATNITYMGALVNGNTQYETLMAHELSHHWWGDNTTCATAEDMWLNEGFASYSEGIFTESVYGTEAYKDYERANHDEVLRRVHLKDGAYYPVSGVPSNQTYSNTVYEKGADMVHTIRGILGDDVFFDALKEFQETHKFSDINSDIFRDFLSNFSGKDLTSFFDTWIKKPGFHHYSIADYKAKEIDGKFQIEGSVKQKLWETTSFTEYLPITISYFDADWNQVDKEMYIYGECSDFEAELDFEPVFVAIDLEEKIQDATVDKYKVINSTGIENFGLARVELDVTASTDSSLVRATHHYIRPDGFIENTNHLHLSPNRYWSINGIFSDGFKANAKFLFNGTTNTTTGFLDNDFINNSEDSLVMLYRPNASTDWEIADSFAINTQGSAGNKRGFITVYNIQKGDYVMAEKDASQTPTSYSKTECVYTGIDNLERLEKLINIYPVPTNDIVNIDFLAPNKNIEKIKVFNILGKEIESFIMKDQHNTIRISTKSWSSGAYIISFIGISDKSIYSKKIIVE